MIRLAVKADAEQILRLLKQIASYHSKLYPEMLRADGSKYTIEQIEEIIEADSTEVFVLEENGKVLAEAICIKRNVFSTPLSYGAKILYIDDFCVDESRRKEGLGISLMEWIKNYAREQEYDQIQLSCWENNEIAHSFYEKEGFSDLKRTMFLLVK